MPHHLCCHQFAVIILLVSMIRDENWWFFLVLTISLIRSQPSICVLSQTMNEEDSIHSESSTTLWTSNAAGVDRIRDRLDGRRKLQKKANNPLIFNFFFSIIINDQDYRDRFRFNTDNYGFIPYGSDDSLCRNANKLLDQLYPIS